MPAISDRPLSLSDVEALQRQLSLLSEPAVGDPFVQAHARCCLGRSELPSPAEVQQFLNAWKALCAGTEWETDQMMCRVLQSQWRRGPLGL